MFRNLMTLTLASAALASQATILTFEGLNLGNYGIIPTAYGDNVTQINDGVGTYQQGNGWTPNVVTSYQSTDSVTPLDYLLYWNTSYSNLTDVAFSAYSGGLASITLSADPGYLVRLNSFNLGSYPSNERNAAVLTITDGQGNVLFDMSNSTVGNSTTNEANLYTPNLVASELTIAWGNDWNIGIDNVNFDQEAVPEPATLSLLALGALALRKRRK